MTSANSQPPPAGRLGVAGSAVATIRSPSPSQATSPWASRPGTASAASAMSAYPSTASARAGASSTSRTVGLEHHREGALAADQEAVEPAAVLGQQVLEGVAGHLPAEPAELGAHERQVLVDQRVERSEQSAEPARASRPPCRRPAARSAPRRCRPCGRSRARASRRRCCRSSRRWCSACASTGRGRSAAPRRCACFCSTAWTTPGWTRAVRASASSASTRPR